jgi:hypothetical protein
VERPVTTTRRPSAVLRVAVALAAAILLVLPADASAASRSVRAVTWDVNHATKTITATVRLRIASACTRGQMARATVQGPAAAKRCKVGPEIAKAIKDNVDAIWNRDYRYFCYTLKVVTDIEVSEELVGAVAGSEAAPGDRAFIAIDQSPVGVRSSVSSRGYPGATWDGYGPRDAVLPANGGPEPSTWEYPPLARDVGLYAHEVGHVMGLDDSYEDVRGADGVVRSQTRAGAPEDLMADQAIITIDKATINRLASRAGVNAFQLKCDWKVDLEAPGGTVTGTKCNGIAGDWVIRTDLVQGPTSVQQTWTFTSDGQGEGTFTYKDHTLTEVPQSKSESWGTSEGTGKVEIYFDGDVTMSLVETTHRSKGKGTAGGRTVTVPESDSPLVTWDFTWKPTVCPPPG